MKSLYIPATPRFAFILLGLMLLLSSGCSRKRSTAMSRAWHNTTSHYNGYFNAREKVNDVAKKLADGQPDKYERVLDIFKLGDDNQAKANYPDLDEAIKKSSIVIHKHSVKIKGKEYTKWIDENYLMVGLAQFYKHDYWTAIETFQFTASEFKESNSRLDAMTWLTLTYMQLGKMVDAEYVIDFLNNQSKMTPKQKQLFSLVKADYYSKKEDIPNEIKALEEAVKNSKKKNDKVRYKFILAQLYQKLGETQKAFELYGKVIKMNPAYELAFNAKINRARSFDVTSETGNTVKKQLTKMLRDDKNKEYLDQIFYALAGIAKKENKEEEEIDLLKKSVAASVSNNNQKAISFLDLGEISFSKKHYREAQAYYDSTMQFLTRDYPGYEQISNKKSTLTRLVENMMVIEQEDSLQAIGRLSEKEREELVAKLIKKENDEKEKLKQEAEKKKQEEQLKESEINQTLNDENIRKNNNQQIPGQSGAWYFYNTAAMSFGFNEFIKKWGNRPLEDNWRRKDKESQAMANDDDGEGKEDMTAYNDSISKLNDAKRKELYLKNLPTTSEALKASNAKVEEAYYNIGIIYREQLKEYPPSRDDFEKLLERFPDSKFKLPTYYNLYRLYSALGNGEKADYYKNLLLTKYGESDYAKLILNPEYFNSKQQRADIIQTYYENTYKAYQNAQYTAVIERKSEADSLFPPNALTPKFELLKSLAIGKTRPINDFELSLREILAHYPKDSVSITAKQILDYITKNNLNGGSNKIEKTTDTTQTSQINQLNSDSSKTENMAIKTPYEFNADTIQYFIMVFDNKNFNMNELKIKISDFNTRFYSLAGYQINNAFLMPERQYLAVKQFENREEASSYMETLLSDEEVFDDKSNYEYQVFLISPSNFAKLMTTKDLSGYMLFYDEHYAQ